MEGVANNLANIKVQDCVIMATLKEVDQMQAGFEVIIT